MLRIQEYLSAFDDHVQGANYLKDRLGLNCDVRYVTYGGSSGGGQPEERILIFNAGEKSDPSEPMVREANGLGLYDTNLKLAYWFGLTPYQSSEMGDWGPVNWKRTCAMEIPEGMEMVIYNHRGHWKIGNHESPNGLGNSQGPGSVFWDEALRAQLDRIFSPWCKPFIGHEDRCFVIRIVKEHAYNNFLKFPHLVLTNVIDRTLNCECPPKDIEFFSMSSGLPAPAVRIVHGQRSLGNVLRNMWILSPGLTFKEKTGNGAFVPNPLYRFINNALEAARISPVHVAKIFQCARTKEDLDKICLKFPVFSDMLYLFDTGRDTAWSELVQVHNIANKQEDAAVAAKMINEHPLGFLIFSYKKGQLASLKEGVDTLRPEKLADFVERRYTKDFQELFSELREELSRESV